MELRPILISMGRGRQGLDTLRVRFPLPALFAVFWTAAADILRVVGAQGAATVATAGVLVVLFPLLFPDRAFADQPRKEPLTQHPSGVPAVLWLFIIWVGVNAALVGFTSQGFQNVSLYVIFVLTIAYCARFSSAGTGEKLLKSLRAAAIVGACLWLPTVALAGPGKDGVLLTRGAAAMVCVVGMIAAVGLVKQSRWAALAPFFFAVVIAATLSRLALVAAALLLIMSVFARAKRIGRALLFRVALVVAAAVVLYQSFPALQQRFSQNDGSSIAGLEVGTSGRTTLWNELLSHLNQFNIFTGRGAGSAEQTIAEQFVRITQPHSDYLRVLNDFGIVGLVLFAGALLALLSGAVWRWRVSPARFRPVHLSAIAAVLTIVLYAFLDNIVIYIFAMMPFAAIIGVSLSRPERDPAPEVEVPMKEEAHA
jgi:O-antigen ligase